MREVVYCCGGRTLWWTSKKSIKQKASSVIKAQIRRESTGRGSAAPTRDKTLKAQTWIMTQPSWLVPTNRAEPRNVISRQQRRQHPPNKRSARHYTPWNICDWNFHSFVITKACISTKNANTEAITQTPIKITRNQVIYKPFVTN